MATVTINNATKSIIDVVCNETEMEVPAIYAGLDTDILESSIEEDQLTVSQLFKILGGFGYVVNFVKADVESEDYDFAIDPVIVYGTDISNAREYIAKEYSRKKKLAEIEELKARLEALTKELGIEKPTDIQTEEKAPKSNWALGGGTCVFRDPDTGEWKRIPTEERTEIIVNYAKDGYSLEEIQEMLHLGESVIRHSLVGRRDEINEVRAAKHYPLINNGRTHEDSDYVLRMGKRWNEDLTHTGCTQKDLAKRYGVSDATVSKYISRYLKTV